ncbi:MAG: P-loop NTPase [Proteobacteria bacterium]|nr:P-loop NTPase [Pseudomonadota bacterium]
MIISVASGKGGTGKTTVATNLAVSLEADVQLLDCDVEEPDAHLFIRPDMAGVETVYTPVPEVDMNRCSLCGKCAEICRFKAIAGCDGAGGKPISGRRGIDGERSPRVHHGAGVDHD